MRFKIGDKVVIVNSGKKGIKKGDICTVTNIIPPETIYLDNKYLAWDIFKGTFGTLVDLAIPNNELSRITYPELVPTECGKYLCTK